MLEVLGEAVVGFGWEAISRNRDKPAAHLAVAAFVYLLLGLMLGAISAFVFPHRLSPNEGVAIFGVFLNTALFGTLMSIYGGRRRRAKRKTTSLATFWGGASLAFGVSAGRLALLTLT